MPKMNVNLYVIEDYREKDDFIVRINKANSNPVLSAVEWDNFFKGQNELKIAKKSGHTRSAVS